VNVILACTYSIVLRKRGRCKAFSAQRGPVASCVAIDRYETRSKAQGLTGESYGLTDLDYFTAGMHPGDLIIVAGRPGMGKSAFAHQVAMRTGGPAVIFTLEMSKEQIADRLVACGSGVNSTKLRTGRIDKTEWPKIISAADRLADNNIFIVDDPNITVQDIARQTRALVRKEGVKVCIVDYLQLMRSDGNKQRHLALGEMSRRLKMLARASDVPVVALSQLNRGLESRENKRPLLSDLRESGSIEQDADVVLMLYRDEVYDAESPDKNIIEIIIRKQRMGPIYTIKCLWDGPTTSIRDLKQGAVTN